jgi:hypothetical protein
MPHPSVRLIDPGSEWPFFSARLSARFSPTSGMRLSRTFALKTLDRLIKRLKCGRLRNGLRHNPLHTVDHAGVKTSVNSPTQKVAYPPTFAVFSRVCRKVSYVRVESRRTIIGIGGRLPQSCHFQRLQDKCVPCEYTVVTEERMPGGRRKVFLASGKVVREVKFRP